MNKILLLVGASGSGKTTVADKLCRKYGLKQIDSYTTRPPRYDGEAFHTFVSDEEFDQLHDFVGYTEYNGYRYGATTEQVETHDVYVIDPAGVEYFRTAYHGGKKVFVAELMVDKSVRIDRMLKRGDGKESAAKRITVDEKIFPIKDADIYLTNVDSERAADVLYKFLMQE